MAVCGQFACASVVASNLGVNTELAQKLMQELLDAGILTKEAVENFDTPAICDALRKKLEGAYDVDLTFENNTEVSALSAEGFPGDIGRSRRANAYIGADRASADNFKTVLRGAYEAAGKKIIDDNTVVDENTVALVEITTESDLRRVVAQCRRVLDAGGRILLPSEKEVSTYASNIKSSKTKDKYEKIHNYLLNSLAAMGASVRSATEFTGRVAQKTEHPVVEKLNFEKKSKIGKLKALNDDVDVKEIEKKAKPLNIKIDSTFTTKEGVSTKADGIEADSLFDAVKDGEITHIYKADTDKQSLSDLKPGDIIPLSSKDDGVIYAEVLDVKTGVTQDQYVEMLKSGEVVTGFSAESAANMTDYGAKNLIAIKPLAAGPWSKAEKKKRKGQKSKGRKKVVTTRYWDREQNAWVEKQTEVWVSGTKEEKEVDTMMRLLAILGKALEKNGYKVIKDNAEKKEAEQKQKTAQENTKSIQKQLATDEKAKLSDEDREAIAQAGLATHINSYFTGVFEHSGNYEEKTDELLQIFDGSRARLEAFVNFMAVGFRESAENVIIPRKLNEYAEEISRLENLIANRINEDGKNATNDEVNGFKRKVRTLNEKIQILNTDGWLGAVRIGDVMSDTLALLSSTLEQVSIETEIIRDYRAEHGEGDFWDDYRRATEEYFGEDKSDAAYSNLVAINYNKVPFADRLTAGLTEFTDKEQEEDESTLDEDEAREAKEARENRTQEEIAAIRQRDKDIMQARRESEALRYDFYYKLSRVLTRAVQVNFDLRIIKNGDAYHEDGELHDDMDIDYDIEEGDKTDYDDPEGLEESGRDLFMLDPDTVGISESLTNKTRLILGSLYACGAKVENCEGKSTEEKQELFDSIYKENEGREEWVVPDYGGKEEKIENLRSIAVVHEITNPEFEGRILIAPGVARNNLLDVFLSANEERGFKDSQEFYNYVKSHIAEQPWYYGLVKEMDKDPSIQTQFFNSMRRTRKRFRSLLKSNKSSKFDADNASYSKYISYAENYSQNSNWVIDHIQAQVSNGLILQRGNCGLADSYQLTVNTSDGEYHYKGEKIKLHDISVYDENARWNKGQLKYENIQTGVNSNGTARYDRIITEASGSYGFCIFVKSHLPQNLLKGRGKEIVMRRDSKELSYMTTALNALGVPCDEAKLRKAFILNPKLWDDALVAIEDFSGSLGVNPMERGYQGNTLSIEGAYIFNHLTGFYRKLANSLIGLSENAVDESFYWGKESRYSVQNRCMMNDIVDELTALSDSIDENDRKRVDEEVKKFIYDKYIRLGDDYPGIDESFFGTKNADGSIEILNPLLRAMMPSSDPVQDKLSKKMRKLFRLGHYQDLGITASDFEGDNTPYDAMSTCQKVMGEIMAFFSPKTEREEDLCIAVGGKKNDDCLDDGSGYGGICCVATPIGAESKGHYLIGMRRRSTQWSKRKGAGVKDGLWIDAHRKGSLLYECSDLVMQEYNRIKVYSSDKANGEQLARPKFQKTFEEKKLQYNQFPRLNDTYVSINGQEFDFTKALEYVLTTSDSVGGDIFVYKKDNKGNIDGAQHKVYEHNGIELHRDIIMTAVHQICLNDKFERSLEQWGDRGLLSTDEDGYYKYLQAEGSDEGGGNPVFVEANKNQKAKFFACNGLVSEMLGVEVGDVRFGKVKIKKIGDAQYTFEVAPTYEGETPAFTELFNYYLNYEDMAHGIKRGDLVDYILSLASRDFGIEILMAQEEDKYPLIEKYKAMGAAVLGKALQEISEKEKTDYIKDALNESTLNGNPYRNLLMEAMQDYAFNKTLNKLLLVQLFFGDLAQFKNEGEFSKRSKALYAAYERCDLAARDKYHLDESGKPRLVREYYGEERITDKKWQYNQKAITIADFKARKMKDGSGRIEGYAGISQFFNDKILPKLQKDLAGGLISLEEFNTLCDGYSNLNMTDGQSFRTIESMKKICDFLGLTTPGMNDIYNSVVIEGKLLSWEQIRDFMQQMKTVSYGFQNVDVEYSGAKLSEEEKAAVKHYSQQFADFTKDSQFTLMFYSQMAEDYIKEMSDAYGGFDSIMFGLHKWASKNHVDVVHCASTKKMGQHNIIDISQCRNADEVIALLDEAKEKAENDPSGASDIFHAESWDNVGRQVAVHEHVEDIDQGLGTQIRWLASCDLEPYFDAVEDYVDENGQVQFRVKRYETEITLRDDDGKPIRSLKPNEFRELLSRINITNLIENYKAVEKFFESKEKFSEFLLDQLERTDKYSEDVKNAVRLNENGDFNLPLDTPQVLRAIGPVIASVIRKRVIKQKTKGGAAVQVSSVGRTEALQEEWGTDEKTGQPYVKYVPCILPAWTKSLFVAFADENGDVDINKVPVHLREMVGYRVPTEYFHSMVPLRVVGFLDKAAGGSILLPQEITVWSDSDFDIDKMFLEMCEFEVVKRGKIDEAGRAWGHFYRENESIKKEVDSAWGAAIEADLNQEQDPQRRSELASLLTYVREHRIGRNDFVVGKKKKSLSLEELKALYGEMSIKFRDYRMEWSKKHEKGKGRVLDILDNDKRFEIMHDFQAFCEQNGYWEEKVTTNGGEELLESSTQEEIENASRMARNNLLVRLHFSRLTSPEALMKLNTPGGFSKAKKVARVIRCLESGRLEDDLNSLPGSEVYARLKELELNELDDIANEFGLYMEISDPFSDDIMFERNMAGKASVGIYALHNAFHSIIQHAPVHLSDEFKENYPIELNGEILDEVGGVRSVDNMSIIKTIGSLLAASTDNAKDPILGDLGLSTLTADFALTLLHLGYSFDTVVLFINQPIIKRLVKDFAISGEHWSLFRKFYYSRVKELEYDPDVKITDKSMADAIKDLAPQRKSFWDLRLDPHQANVLLMFGYVMTVTRTIKNMMDMTKIHAPKNSMANTIGETYKRLLPIKKKGWYNTTFVGKQEITVFDSDEYMNLVQIDFDDNEFTNKTVDEYHNGYEGRHASNLPEIQASLDFGYVRPLRPFGKNIGSWSKAALDCADSLDSLFPEPRRINFNGDLVDDLVRERTLFLTINDLILENRSVRSENGVEATISEARRAFLTSFPKYYKMLLQNYKEYGAISKEAAERRGITEGVDLQSTYDILRHIIVEPNKSKRKLDGQIEEFLKYTKDGGKTDRTVQNDLTDGWTKLFLSGDPVLQDLAICLLQYSMFYNGCNFSPVTFGQYAPGAVYSEFPLYIESLRNRIGKSEGELLVNRYLSQFVMNHADDFFGTLITKVNLNLKKNSKYVEELFTVVEEEGHNKKGDAIKIKSRQLKKLSFRVNKTEELGNCSYVVFTNPVKTGGYFRVDEFYFKKVGDSDGWCYFEYVEKLGNGSFVEYDRDHDLTRSTKLGQAGYLEMFRAQAANDANRAASEKLAKIREKQNNEEAALRKMASLVTDDRPEGSESNDSEFYYMTDENGKRVDKGFRVHNFVAEHCGGIDFSESPKYTSGDKEGKPIFTQEQWQELGDRGTGTGSGIDTFFRLYIKKNEEHRPLTAEEQKRYDGIAEVFAKKKVDINNMSVEGAAENLSPVEKLEKLAAQMVYRLRLVREDVKVNGMVTRYKDEIFTEFDGKPIRVFATVDTPSGKVTIGGELDFIIKRGDGTWEIGDWKTMNTLCAKTMLEKSILKSGRNCYWDVNLYANNESKKFKDPKKQAEVRAQILSQYKSYEGRFSNYEKNMNTYAAIIQNVVPGINISRMFLSVITTKKQYPGDGDFSSASITRLEFTTVGDGNLSGGEDTVEIQVDSSLVGIRIPKPTVQEAEEIVEEVESEGENTETEGSNSTEQDTSHNGPYSDGYSSYGDIFEKMLGKEALSSENVKDMISILDHERHSESQIKMLKASEHGDEITDDMLSKDAKERRSKFLSDTSRIERRLKFLFQSTYSDSVYKNVANAVANHKQVVDDTQTPLCK